MDGMTGASTRNCVKALAVSVVFASALAVVLQGKRAYGSPVGCQIPAIYNFGDSNSDTGSVSAAFGRLPYPYGVTFFGRPSGRFCDGRLIIDFIAEKLGLPLLSGYLDSIESSFRHGSNFAVSASTIERADAKVYGSGFNPLSLNIQLLQYEQLKERTAELYKKGNLLAVQRRLMRSEDFPKALYTFDIGQNDIHYGIITMTEDQVRKSIPYLINQLANTVETLHRYGARLFWIHNTGPIGCLPFFVGKHISKQGNTDPIGCVKSYNEIAKDFNKMLKDSVSKLRVQLRGSNIIYVDIYSVKYSLIRDAKKYGFVDPLGYCCKHPEDSHLKCQDTTVVNGTRVYATPCKNISKYISWDSIHYTEAANRWVANKIIDGSFSDPPMPITNVCHALFT